MKASAKPPVETVRLAILHPELGVLAASSARFTRKEAIRLLGESRPGTLAIQIPDDMPRPPAKRTRAAKTR